MKTPPIQIDPKQLATLDAEDRQEVEETLEIINDPVSGTEYAAAWQRLVDILPGRVTSSLLARTYQELSQEDHPHHEYLPYFMQGAVVCFSSAQFDYPRKAGEFWETRYIQPHTMNIGWEYLPLIEASLNSGRCSPDDVIAILDDLMHLGAPNLEEIAALIAEKHWQDTPEFGRAYLRLANQLALPRQTEEELGLGRLHGYKNTPEQVAVAENLLRAIILLVPEKKEVLIDPQDESLIRDTFGKCLNLLFKKERHGFFNALIIHPRVQSRPDLVEKLKRWGDISLRRSL